MTIAEARRLIAPVKPDTLSYMGNGLFRAIWLKEHSAMDYEIMQRTPGVTIVKPLGDVTSYDDNMEALYVFCEFGLDPYAASSEGRDWFSADSREE